METMPVHHACVVDDFRLAGEPGDKKDRSEPVFALQLVYLINKTE